MINKLMRKVCLLFLLPYLFTPLFGQDSDLSITLTNRGVEGSYSVFIDGEPAGESLAEIRGLIPGEHYLEIRQIRLGVEKTIFNETVSTGTDTVDVEFRIPDILRSESRTIGRIKLEVEKALRNNASLFDLRTELDVLLEKMGDLSISPVMDEERLILTDYALKVQIEIEQRKSVTAFIYRDPVELSFYERNFDFYSDYKSKVTTGSVDFSRALKYALILKRLELLVPLIERDFDLFETMSDEALPLLGLASRVSPEFSKLYRDDFDYLTSLYAMNIGERVVTDRYTFYTYIESYYGDIWSTLIAVEKKGLRLDSKEVRALQAAYAVLEPRAGYTREMMLAERDTLKWNNYLGGGSLLTSGIYWEPARFFALQVGVSFAYDFFNRTEGVDIIPNQDSLTLAVPLELDFLILNRNFNLYVGVTADLFRIQNSISSHWSNSWGDGSYIAFLTTAGVNLGASLEIRKIDLFIHNYLYFNDLFTGGFDSVSMVYAPAIGVRF